MNNVELQVQRHRLEGIAEEMGDVLQRTAFSPNIKERRDFSCAICDNKGQLMAQAAHIPVHLGSIPATMNSFIDQVSPEPGDGYLLNDPYSGGTHLPDLSYIKPVFENEEVLFFVINRAHHTDIGGKEAGSMARSSHIDDEGFRTDARKIVSDNVFMRESINDLLKKSRTPQQRVTDLEAQISSGRRGVKRMQEWYESVDFDVGEIFNGLVKHSIKFVENFINKCPRDSVQAVDYLDGDGIGQNKIKLKAELAIEENQLEVDYTGTDDQVDGNLNCPRAVSTSATYYVLRSLIKKDAPMNQGIINAVNIKTRSGSLLDVEYPGAVAAGNVETSQRIVDVLFKGFDKLLPGSIPAASQGTMNNLTIGIENDNHRKSYYETLGGGAGGGPEYRGIDGRQVHMTNTQNTPIEEFERRFPIRVDDLRIREGSGGEGRHRGGDGLIKSLTALEDIKISLITERRDLPPYGLRAESGKKGHNILHSDGKVETLPGKTTITLKPGDTLILKTPGGGGWNPV